MRDGRAKAHFESSIRSKIRVGDTVFRKKIYTLPALKGNVLAMKGGEYIEKIENI